MNKLYSISILPMLIFLWNIECNDSFSAEAGSKDSQNEYTLTIKMDEGNGAEFEFELYDLNTGKLIFKKRAYFNAGDKKLIFERIKPSTYTVYYSSDNCGEKKSIKGKGIFLQ